MKYYTKILVSVAIVLFLASCNRDKSATLNIRLTDSPAAYDAVKVDVQKVLVNASDNENTGWIEMETTPGIYNLLDYTAGKSTLIATAPLNVPQIKQIRLVLGTNNSVVIKGVEYKLDTPSAMQSGLKLKVNQTLNEGVEYTAILDFDASKSVVPAGASGKYNLKPVIRLSFAANTGSIKGSVDPVTEKVLVRALNTTDTISTYSSPTTGIFLVPAVPAGTYNVEITTDSLSLYKSQTVTGVIVKTGETTQLDKLVLVKK